MKKDDRLKVYETEGLKTLLKTPCSQDLGAGVVQSNCILERIKGWQTYNCLREGIPRDYAQQEKGVLIF